MRSLILLLLILPVGLWAQVDSSLNKAPVSTSPSDSSSMPARAAEIDSVRAKILDEAARMLGDTLAQDSNAVDSASLLPHAQFATTERHFGSLPRSVQAFHDFVITNTGKDTLKVISASSFCPCIKTNVKDSIILPGKEGIVQVMLDTRGYAGRIDEYVRVLTNTPAATQVLRLTAKLPE